MFSSQKELDKKRMITWRHSIGSKYVTKFNENKQKKTNVNDKNYFNVGESY